MKKKGIIIGAGVVAVAAVCVIAYAVFGKGKSSDGNPESQVYVDSVADLCGLGSGNGLIDRFSGIVEPQETKDIEVPSDKKVKEVLVEEGDEVKIGDALFVYDTEEMEENLAQAEIDLDRLGNEITQTQEQIEALKKEKANAPADSQLSYTTQINTAENDIKRKEYEQKSKKMEIEKLKNGIANTTVTSEMDGMVKYINSIENPEMDSMTGETKPFMTILANGDFRIKGTVNEQNRSAVSEGMPVLIHSRVDDTTWNGTLVSVDWENAEKSSNMMYYGGGSDEMDSSSNYPFYVELESADGLMLGQHVYIERNDGQEEPREGLWLDTYYIVQEDGGAYVWAADKKERMEKRDVTLGEFDEEMQQYQILDGLTEEDYIAFPDESIKEGDTAVKNVDQTMDMNGMEDMGGSGVEDFDGGSYGEPGVKGMDEELDDGSLMDDGTDSMDLDDEDVYDGDMDGMDDVDLDGADGMGAEDGAEDIDATGMDEFRGEIEDAVGEVDRIEEAGETE